MVPEEEEDPSAEQEEDVLREGVRDGGVPRRVRDGRRDQQHERARDRETGVEVGPGGVDEIREQEEEEDVGERDGHAAGPGGGASRLTVSHRHSPSRVEPLRMRPTALDIWWRAPVRLGSWIYAKLARLRLMSQYN